MSAVAGLLVVGGIVGAATLNEEPNRSTSQIAGGERPAESLKVADSVGAPGPRAVPEGQTHALTLESNGPAGMAAGSSGSVSAGGGGAGASAQVTAEPLPPLDAGRVVKTATLEIEVGEKGFDAAHDRALREVSQAGGFVQSSNLRPTRASITFRVPADEFEATLTRLRDLGKVKDETVTGEDVTEEFVDLESRLRHWTAQEAVFLDLLGRAKNVAETVEVRRELSTIQQTIEQLQGRIRFLDDRTGFSTVSMELFVPGAAPKPEENARPSLSEAWNHAWDAAVTVIGGTLIVLGALVPLAAMGGIVGLVLWAGLRRRHPPAPSPAG